MQSVLLAEGRRPVTRQMGQDAAPAGSVVSRTLGGLGTPPYGHYDPCARSSLNGCPAILAGEPQARPEVERVPQQSAGRRASLIAKGRGTPRKRAGAARNRPGGLASPRVSRRSAPLLGCVEGKANKAQARAPRQAGGGALAA